MTTRKILRIDLQNTVQDEIGAIIKAVYKTYGWIQQRSDYDCWDPPLGLGCGLTNAEFTAWAWGNPEIQRRALPFRHVQREMARLCERYEVIITTSTPHLAIAIDWLYQFGIPYSSIEQASSKAHFPDWLLDDSPATLATAQKPIRFGLPWNNSNSLRHLPRIYGWQNAAARIQAIIG